MTWTHPNQSQDTLISYTRPPTQHRSWEVAWLSCFYRSSGPPPRPTKSSFVVLTIDQQIDLPDVERNDKDASKPVARHFYFPKHSQQHMAVCGLSLTTSAFHSINLLLCHLSYSNLFLFSRLTDSVAPFSAYKHTHNPRFLQSLWRRANARNVSF